MERIVKEKHPEQVDGDFLKSEAEILYQEFDNEILEHFSRFIPENKKGEFDQLKNGGDPSQTLAFLMDNIDNFEFKILQYLADFRNKYLHV